MRREKLLIALLVIEILMSTLIEPIWAQNKGSGRKAGYSFSFSYTPVYQFETDLDSGGSFDVSRHYLNFDVIRPFGQNLRLGLGLNYEFEKWNFNNMTNVVGATPWGSIHRPGISLPIFYTFSDNWILGFSPSVEYSGESGAKFSESLNYGGILSLSHPFSRNLYLGLGFGLFSRLEKTTIFPFIVIDWKISEQFRITNPFRAGPAGPAGLEFVYSPAENWELAIGGAYRFYRFRLDDKSAVPNGIGDNKFVVAFLRAQRKLGANFSIDLAGGALFAGKLSIENSTGDKLGSDNYDPSPFLALTLAGKF
jgi:hypothetical protein